MSKEATLQSDECGVCWARDGGSPRLPRASAASNACARLYLALLLWGKTDGEDEPEAQLAQLVEPVFTWYVPDPQLKQKEAPELE